MTSKRRFREIIKKRLKPFSLIMKHLENKEFKVKDIPKIVALYNTKCVSK